MPKVKRCPYCGKKMKFRSNDWNWSDWHKGLTPERRKRYAKVIVGIAVFVNELLNSEEYIKYNLKAAIPEGIFSTGVQGDNRTYAPVVMLFGKFPGYDILEDISTKITNAVPVNRVAHQISGLNPFED
ncbi:hypothetical protein HY406_01440 [Candidatus Giovannonibacteria bacterium]|nr:hypothetical protein [Candidatus Giovannonibacteria bacterium]